MRMQHIPIAALTFFLLKKSSFSTVNAVECSTSLINIDVSGLDINWYEELSSIATGGSTSISLSSGSSSSDDNDDDSDCSVCSAAGYDIEGGITIDESVWEIFGLAETAELFNIGDIDISLSGSFSSEFCGSEVICDILSGYTALTTDTSSSCQSLSFGFDIWVPTNCNSTKDYGAIEIYYNYGYSFGCCDSNNCNDNFFDTNECEEVGGFTSYMNGLVNCWSDIQVELATYLFCNTIGSGVEEFKSECLDDGDWTGSLTDCTYQLTCNDDFIDYLSTFGVCACSAAYSSGYPGDLISEVLEFLWSQYCGDINLTCTDKGDLDLSILYNYINFEISYSDDYSTNDIALDDIKTIIKKMSNVDKELIDVIATSIDGINSNITISIKTSSNTDATTIGNLIYGDSGADFESNYNDVIENLGPNDNVTTSSLLVGNNLLTISDYYINKTIEYIDTSDVELSPSGQLFATNWQNADPWTLAGLASSDGFLILSWVFLPIFLTAIAVFYVKHRKPNMIQCC